MISNTTHIINCTLIKLNQSMTLNEILSDKQLNLKKIMIFGYNTYTCLDKIYHNKLNLKDIIEI